MGYQVLARKWRPSAFDQMVGQEHVVKALTTALESERLHHAYLFTGTRGVGKTTLARLLAKSLNCETGMTASPCGQCSSCLEIAEGRSVDVLEVDAASRTKVEDTRDLLDNVQYAPAHARFKIYLIDEVHMLSNHSFNALLKTLEEPPGHVKFLLATTDPQKLPATVLSRCLQFNLKNMLPDQIVGHLDHVLAQEAIEFEREALNLLARAAEGSMRDALSLTDQAISHGAGSLSSDSVRQMLGAVSKTKVLDLLDTIVAGDAAAALGSVEDIAIHSPDYRGTLDELASVLHQVAILQMVPDSLEQTAAERERMVALAAKMTLDEAQLWYQMALAAKRDLSLASDPRAGLDMAVLRMIAFRPAVIIHPQGTGVDLPKKPNPPVLPVASEPPISAPHGGDAPTSTAGEAASRSIEPADSERFDATPAPVSMAVSNELESGSSAAKKEAEHVELGEHTEAVSVAAADIPDQHVPSDTLRPAVELGATVAAGANGPSSPSSHVNQGGQADDLPTHGSWCDFFEELNLKGVIHSVASHFELDKVVGRVLHFKIAEQQTALFNPRHATSLASAIGEYTGDPVEVVVAIAMTGEMTPHRQRELKERARVAAAEQALANDDSLTSLLADFDGEVVAGSVRPPLVDI